MNRYIFPAIIVCATLAMATLVSAQATTSSTTIAAETTVVPTKRPFVAEPTLQKVAQARLTNLAANMSNRMDATVKRLQNVTDRLTSRLNKMTEEGKNVDLARAELANTQTKLDEAKRNLITIDTEVNAFIGSATPRENWQNLKNTYVVTRTALILAHQSILTTITLATSAGETIKPTAASTTAATTNN